MNTEFKKVLNFINGEWVAPKNGRFLENKNPALGEVFSLIPDSDYQDIDLAVESASAAFKKWSMTSAEERSRCLYRLADLLEKNIDEFAKLESQDQGKPWMLAKNMDISRAILNFRFFAGAILHTENESTVMDDKSINYVIRKPVGVAGLISPWNLPLYLLTWKLAPALACGNTVVCKPSEFTSMTAAKLCELLAEAGIPAGVVNMVFGTGHDAGEALVKHPQVPLISFTGGTETGKKVIHASAEHFKKLSLELGGKNPNIIFADCEYDKMLKTTVRSSFLNQGEICLCGSRIYVQENIYDKFVQDLVNEAEALRVDDPSEKRTFMGALVSEAHLAKVNGFIRLAEQEGGKIRTGGARPKLSEKFDKGYFLAPTVITDLPESSPCIQQEIFGPVVTVSKFQTLDEVIKKANGVVYGLSATVWTSNLNTAQTLARSLDVGTVWVNTWMNRDLRVPFGGSKASGLGREGGRHSLDFYSELVTVCLS
jgi:aminomuconate-semialdehyde/2-hydroxymuconate-6-semialdehyde dehydrogenase